jgi:hypothetical protein
MFFWNGIRRENQASPFCAKNFATPLEVCKDEESCVRSMEGLITASGANRKNRTENCPKGGFHGQ